MLTRFLQRASDRRFRDIGDVRVALLLEDEEATDAPRGRRNPTTMILSAVTGRGVPRVRADVNVLGREGPTVTLNTRF